MHDEILTVKEVADLLKTTRQQVRKMIVNEELPAVKVGREWRVLKAGSGGFHRQVYACLLRKISDEFAAVSVENQGIYILAYRVLVRFAGELSVKSAYTFQQLRFDQCMRLQRLACLLIFPVYILVTCDNTQF